MRNVRIMMRNGAHLDDRMLRTMRTTVNLEQDVAAAVERMRREQGMGLSEALNELARRGLVAEKHRRRPFKQKPYPMGAKLDLTNIGRVLEELDGPAHR